MGNVREFWRLLREGAAEFFHDNALSRGAAISFYAMTAMGPALYICVWVAGLIYGSKMAHTRLFAEVRRIIGHDTAATLQAAMEGSGKFHAGFWPGLIGTVVLVLTAGGVFVEVQTALNHFWKTPDPPFTVWRMVRTWMQSIGLIFVIDLLLCTSLLINTLINAFGRYFEYLVGIGSLVVWLGNALFSAVLITFLFAAIYRVLPNRELQWRDVGVGAAITTVLILIGEYLISIYLAVSALSSRYGAAGGVIAVLMWLYYSVQVFLLGAEITKVWSRRHGSPAARAAAVQRHRLDRAA